jgi:hypothetical protein
MVMSSRSLKGLIDEALVSLIDHLRRVLGLLGSLHLAEGKARLAISAGKSHQLSAREARSVVAKVTIEGPREVTILVVCQPCLGKGLALAPTSRMLLSRNAPESLGDIGLTEVGELQAGEELFQELPSERYRSGSR